MKSIKFRTVFLLTKIIAVLCVAFTIIAVMLNKKDMTLATSLLNVILNIIIIDYLEKFYSISEKFKFNFFIKEMTRNGESRYEFKPISEKEFENIKKSEKNNGTKE